MWKKSRGLNTFCMHCNISPYFYSKHFKPAINNPTPIQYILFNCNVLFNYTLLRFTQQWIMDPTQPQVQTCSSSLWLWDPLTQGPLGEGKGHSPHHALQLAAWRWTWVEPQSLRDEIKDILLIKHLTRIPVESYYMEIKNVLLHVTLCSGGQPLKKRQDHMQSVFDQRCQKIK